MDKKILIISNEKDGDANLISKNLTEVGSTVFRFNTEDYQQGKTFITLCDDGSELLEINRTQLELTSLQAVWFRKPGQLSPKFSDPRDKVFASDELTELLEQVYMLAPQARWVNKPYAMRYASHKYHQLKIAKSIGFQIPHTCVTNSPKKAEEFIKMFPGGAIYKTLFSPTIVLNARSVDVDSDGWDVPTSRIEEKHIAMLDTLPLTGGIFQEYIEKEYEIRVSVIGTTVLAAKINSQKSNSGVGKTDWRFAQDVPGAIETYTLPKRIEELCKKLVKNYDLLFGAIDLIRKPGGEYVFLEINPNGQWAWLEKHTGDPYIKTFTTFLTQP